MKIDSESVKDNTHFFTQKTTIQLKYVSFEKEKLLRKPNLDIKEFYENEYFKKPLKDNIDI